MNHGKAVERCSLQPTLHVRWTRSTCTSGCASTTLTPPEERLDLGTTVVALGRVEQGPNGPVLTGLLLCATWASVLSQPPEPLPNTEPTRSTPRNP